MPENRVNASDDVIGALSDRVADLSKRVNDLQAELEAAQKRLAVYEEFDATVKEAISGALRAAYQIRERAEATANQILEQAREERRMLLKEVERLRDERDALMEEIARERRGGIAAVAPRREAVAEAAEAASAELRALATEALRSMFKEIVAEVARATQVAAAPTPAPAPAPEHAPEPEPLVAQAPPPVMEAPPPIVEAPPPVMEAPAAASAPLFVESEDTLAAVEPPPLFEVPRLALEPPAAIEDTETAPSREEIGAPTSEIQLVLSPVGSFARLVEIERRIQTISTIRSLYVRDFRGGVATLAVGLRSPMTLSQFADALAGLGQPQLRALSATRNSLELRLEGDASIA